MPNAVWPEPRVLRYQGSGPQPVVFLDELVGYRSEIILQLVEIGGEGVSLELMLDCPGHERTQAPGADVILDPSREVLFDAD